MTEDMRILLAVGAMVLFVVFGVARMLSRKPSGKQRFIARAEQKGNFVTATLVESKFRYGARETGNAGMKHDSIRVTYEYQVRGVSYQKKLTFYSRDTISIDYPSEITVYYDPERPSKGICPEEATVSSRNSWGCLFTIVGAFAAFFLVYFLLGKL